MNQTVSIFILDDEPDECELVAKFLAPLYEQVTPCLSVDEFLHRYRPGEAAVLITDYLLRGGKTGLELVEQIRSQFWPVSVIVMTGQDCADTGTTFMQAGVSALFVKPVKMHDIIKALPKAIQETNQLRTNATQKIQIASAVRSLTTREIEAAIAMFELDSKKDATERMQISPNTFNNYWFKASKKLPFKNISDKFEAYKQMIAELQKRKN